MHHPHSDNHFLASLSGADLASLQPHLKSYALSQGEILYRADEQIDHLYFPYDGVVSLVVGMSNGQFIEAGMFGRNTVVGAGGALDGLLAINHAVIQVASAGARATAVSVKRLTFESDTLRLALAQHAELMPAHAQQVAACNALHQSDQRLCRWLLQVRDLVKSDELNLTQEYLAQMLGVRRTTVSVAAADLQKNGLINYRRGRIRVLDVHGLAAGTCECYGAINGHFRRLVGWTPEFS